MLPDIASAVRLQELDNRLTELTKEIASLPKHIAEIEKKLESHQRKLEADRGALAANQKDRKRLEGDTPDRFESRGKFLIIGLSQKLLFLFCQQGSVGEN